MLNANPSGIEPPLISNVTRDSDDFTLAWLWYCAGWHRLQFAAKNVEP